MQGYTLLELLIVLSIVAAISVMASPDFKACYCHAQTQRVIKQIARELLQARSLAITHRQTLNYCAEDGRWSHQRIITTTKGQIFSRFESLPNSYLLTLQNSLHCNNCITFTPLGFTLQQRGSFYLVTEHENIRLILDLSGRLRRS